MIEIQGGQAKRVHLIQPNLVWGGARMCGMLDHYRHLFRRLRVDTSPHGWNAATTFRAPYKPFLLLSIMDMIANGSITRNFIEPSAELSETWRAYLALTPQANGRAPMAASFFRMGNEGFWHLKPRAGLKQIQGEPITSMKRLKEYYYGAQVNDDLFPLLQMQPSREKLGTAVIENYFGNDLGPRLREHSALNSAKRERQINVMPR